MDFVGCEERKVIGFYPGVFDVLHAGHLLSLKEAKENCDYLIVGLHCNPNYKSPVQSIYERWTQLESCKYVDKIVPYEDTDDLKDLLLTLDYDVYFLGEDYINKDFAHKDVLMQEGKCIHYLKRKHNYSSTNLKNRIKGGN